MSDVHEIVAAAVLPATPTTLQTVVGIWQRVLQRPLVRADDNFFDLGGDSLLAIQMFAELERVTGRKLPITAIYDATTPADLADVVDATSDGPVFSPLVLLNDVPWDASAARVPVFLIHGIGGNVMELTKLGQCIEPDRRVYAIQARGLDGILPAIDSVHEMADVYWAEIRRVQPHGPYVLVGYSFGGIVALEMARRIRAVGETIGFMGFIDSYPHPDFWPTRSWIDVRWRRAAQSLKTRLHLLRLQLQGRLRPAGANAMVRPFMFDEGWPEAMRRVYDVSLAALARYRPASYPGPVVFFRAGKRSYYLPNDPRGMWGKLLGHIEIVTVPGDHMEMVDQNAASLGAALATSIRASLAQP